MKIKHINILLLLSIIFFSCIDETPSYEKLTDSKEGAQVFIAKGGTEINYLTTFSFESGTITPHNSFRFNVGFGAVGLPANPIKIELIQDANIIDSINQLQEINGDKLYYPFPEDAFAIENLNLEIATGKEYSNFVNLEYYPEKFELEKNYLLALSIKDASGYSINADKKAILLAVSEVDIPKPGIDITIMSYGIGSGNKNMESLAADIKKYNPDLLVIREIDVNTTRSGPADLPKILSTLIEMPHYVFANSLNYQGGEYGTAVFSKFPINTSSTTMLPTSHVEKGPLGIIDVQINDDERLIFAGTHLGAADWRKETQLPVLVDKINNYSEDPLILAGNFNAEPITGDSYQYLAPLFSFPCTNCPPNFPANNPKTHSDYIMFRPADKFEFVSYEVGNSSVSSHLPVILKLRLLFE